MDIVAAKGQTIETMAEWKRLYDSPRTKHQWKEHRSAYSVAEFILNRNGAEALRARVSDAIGETVQFERNTPEMEVRFDQFGRGRMHDLGISGKSASGKSVFVGVEAKVDEPFGAPVGEVYLGAKARDEADEATNAPELIEQLYRRIEAATTGRKWTRSLQESSGDDCSPRTRLCDKIICQHPLSWNELKTGDWRARRGSNTQPLASESRFHN